MFDDLGKSFLLTKLNPTLIEKNNGRAKWPMIHLRTSNWAYKDHYRVVAWTKLGHLQLHAQHHGLCLSPYYSTAVILIYRALCSSSS